LKQMSLGRTDLAWMRHSINVSMAQWCSTFVCHNFGRHSDAESFEKWAKGKSNQLDVGRVKKHLTTTTRLSLINPHRLQHLKRSQTRLHTTAYGNPWRLMNNALRTNHPPIPIWQISRLSHWTVECSPTARQKRRLWPHVPLDGP
jgi:hypothetical protein